MLFNSQLFVFVFLPIYTFQIYSGFCNWEREITPENIEEHFSNMYSIAIEYPYDEIWAE